MTLPPDAILGIMLPHQLGKLCLQLRLLRIVRRLLPATTQLWGFTNSVYRNGIKRLGIFDRILLYGEKADAFMNVLADLTSYDYSYESAALQDYDKLVRRNVDEPWKIHVVSSLDQTTHVCPVLQPGTGRFAVDNHASAMLCEMPILNLCLDRPVDDFGLSTVADAPLGSSVGVGSNTSETILFLMGGASRPKHYPLLGWLALKEGLQARGSKVLAVTGPDECWLLRELEASGMPFLESTDLANLMDHIRASTAVVTNDCGPMHVALMLGHPTLGIFGPTIPEAWFCRTGPDQICIQTEHARRSRSDLIRGDAWADWPHASDVLAYIIAILNGTCQLQSSITYVA
jgi:hypothetical protein